MTNQRLFYFFSRTAAVFPELYGVIRIYVNQITDSMRYIPVIDLDIVNFQNWNIF